MDVETSTAIEALRVDLGSTEARLDARIASVAEDLRREIREGDAETRRHSMVLFESLHDDIRLVAEAVASLTVKVDRLTAR